jgi:hypothetical protein
MTRLRPLAMPENRDHRRGPRHFPKRLQQRFRNRLTIEGVPLSPDELDSNPARAVDGPNTSDCTNHAAVLLRRLAAV